MKRIIALFTLTIAFAMLLTSCADTEVKLSKKLDGTWNVTSFKVQDLEFLGSIFTAISFNFSDDGEGMGTFSQTTTTEILGTTETETVTGTYQITSDDNGDVLAMTSDGDTISGTLDVSGKTMTFTFTEDGETAVIVGEKQ